MCAGGFLAPNQRIETGALFPPSQCYVLLCSDFWVWICPAFPRRVDKHNPEKIVLWAVVDDEMGKARSFRCRDGQWGIELGDHSPLSLIAAAAARKSPTVPDADAVLLTSSGIWLA